MTTLLGATIARVPAPSMRVDLQAASYPAVLVGALVPVLIGMLAVAPVPVRLGWLSAGGSRRVRALRIAEFSIVVVAACAASAVCGAPAGLGVVAVQNALVTMAAAEVTALLVGAGVAVAFAGWAAVVMLLASPGHAQEAWVVVDTQADPTDWIVLGVLAVVAMPAVVSDGPGRRVGEGWRRLTAVWRGVGSPWRAS